MKKKLIILLLCFSQNLISKSEANSWVTFESGMSKNYAFNPEYLNRSKEWNTLKELYNKNVIENKIESKRLKIPKILHWIWLGSPLPERCKRLQKTWQEKHPDWEFKVWTDADVKSFKLQNQAYFDNAVNWGEKSDIFRYEILYRYGGLYTDTDFECLKSFDQLHYLCDLYTGIAYDSGPVLYNGLIGVAPRHPMMKACIDNMVIWGHPQDEDAIMARTGPVFFTRIFFKTLEECKNDKIVAFPTSYFYPFPNNLRHRAAQKNFVDSYIRPESFCVHLFATSWTKK